MKTLSVKDTNYTKEWLIVDATDKPVGRLASEVSRLLRGKHKPSFTPHVDCGDNVIVINASKVRFTGNKLGQKNYYHHTGYIGGLKTISAKNMLNDNPDRIISKAVKGMLAKNKMSRKLLKHLRIYPDATHNQEAQNPKPAPARLV